MIHTTLKTALTTAGCTLVFYESTEMVNTLTDQSKPEDIIGIVKEPDTMTFGITGNGVRRSFPLTVIEILKQVGAEAGAENNLVALEACTSIAEILIHNLIDSEEYKKITEVVALKISEKRYDANVIGWALSLNLQRIDNKIPC